MSMFSTHRETTHPYPLGNELVIVPPVRTTVDRAAELTVHTFADERAVFSVENRIIWLDDKAYVVPNLAARVLTILCSNLDTIVTKPQLRSIIPADRSNLAYRDTFALNQVKTLRNLLSRHDTALGSTSGAIQTEWNVGYMAVSHLAHTRLSTGAHPGK